MRTIKIKNKKYILNKIIYGILLLLLCNFVIFIFSHLKFQYQYYVIEPNGDIYNIGTSFNKRLIEDTLDESLAVIAQKNNIIDFYFIKYFDKKKILIWDNNKNNDNDIKKTIQNNIVVILDKDTSRGREVVISLAS